MEIEDFGCGIMLPEKSYQWSLSTLGCPDISWVELLELMRRFGLKTIELRALEGDLNLPQVLLKTFGGPQQWAEAVTRAGITVNSFDTSLKLTSSAEEREAFLEFLPWAEAVGGANLRVFDGGQTAPKLDAEYLRLALDTIQWWQGLRVERGYKSDIMIETHDALCHLSACEAFQVACGSPVQILWDSHHTWKKAGEPLDMSWKGLKANVPHVHFKDSISDASARHPFTYVEPGKGEFPLKELFAMLDESNYSGILSLEWERKWHPYLAPVDEALEALVGSLLRRDI